MKKYIIILVAILVLAGGILLALLGPSGPSFLGVSLLSSERAMLNDRTYDFLEDLQFKDFEKASTYHLPETQEKRDIPELLRRIFLVKHEILDIKSFKILEIDFDRGGDRARVRSQVFYRVLGDQKARENESNDRNVEILFYWFKQSDGRWVMELESSLR